MVVRWAARHRHGALARWATRHGRYRFDSGPDSLLNDAVTGGDVALVRDLLATGTSLDANWEGVTPLHAAVSSQQDAMMALLLASGADANARSLGGVTPLGDAAGVGRADYVARLLAAGADARAVDASGHTPLMWATETGGDLPLVRTLVEHGADVNAVHPRDGETALLYAARACKPDVVAYLIDAGADPRWQDAGGMADDALTAAAVQDRSDNIAALVAKGVDVNHRNRDGLTALMAIASSSGRVDATRTLLRLGADPSLREPGGLTTVDVACRAREYDKADLLTAAAATRPAAVPVDPVPDSSHDHVPAD